MEKLSKKITRPFGAGVHLTGDQEMGMEAEGYGGVMRNAGPLRHMPSERMGFCERKETMADGLRQRRRAKGIYRRNVLDLAVKGKES
jgi:hypothetical protein